jgi:hypothetical protein
MEESGQHHVTAALARWKSSRYPLNRRLSAPELVWTVWRRENFWPHRDSNTDPSVVQPLASHYTAYAYGYKNITIQSLTTDQPIIVLRFLSFTLREHFLWRPNSFHKYAPKIRSRRGGARNPFSTLFFRHWVGGGAPIPFATLFLSNWVGGVGYLLLANSLLRHWAGAVGHVPPLLHYCLVIEKLGLGTHILCYINP